MARIRLGFGANRGDSFSTGGDGVAIVLPVSTLPRLITDVFASIETTSPGTHVAGMRGRVVLARGVVTDAILTALDPAGAVSLDASHPLVSYLDIPLPVLTLFHWQPTGGLLVPAGEQVSLFGSYNIVDPAGAVTSGILSLGLVGRDAATDTVRTTLR